MGKNKLKKFSDIAELDNVIEPSFDEIYNKKYKLSGHWKSSFFRNNNPVVLELGCGKGEYTTGLAEQFTDKNFLGVDIKGARIWKGATYANEHQMTNAGFLRTRIELIDSFFEEGEIHEIWITFPDPQLKRRRNKKRLTGSRFLNLYRKILVNDGIIHLKTDNEPLFTYTLQLARQNKLEILFETSDLYHSGINDNLLAIKTYYEEQFLNKGMNIHYLKFRLPRDKTIEEPAYE